MARYVIIGNGVAGATAAEKILAAKSGAQLTIFTSEDAPFYYRPRLPEFIAGQSELAKFTLHDAAHYAQRGVDLRLATTVASVDPAARVVHDAAGGAVAYDELLLACGARPFIPPVSGADKAGVTALRDIADARRIVEMAGQNQEVVLVGGGLLGLEAGAALVRLGLKARVVEFFERLLPRQMDARGAAKLQAHLEAMGFEFYLGQKAKEITGQAKADGLLLESGQHLPGGLILFSAGVRPNLDLARQMGLDIGQAVKVDDRMATDMPGVWAAGDVAEHRGRYYGVWPAAQAQGAVAGANMAGGHELYQGTIVSNALKVVGVDLVAGGDIDAEGKLPAAVFEDERVYRKIVLDEGQIKGFIFYGQAQGARQCQKAMEQGRDVAEHAQAMTAKDFDFDRLLG
ncbi:NAD(P)/FAD-dependent oxidoreductase [Desulfarculus baarsii]